jgi:phenylacetate-CoA ligase
LVLANNEATPDLAERIRKELFTGTFTLSTAFQHDPDSFQVVVADTLITNDRTGKTANFLVREDS